MIGPRSRWWHHPLYRCGHAGCDYCATPRAAWGRAAGKRERLARELSELGGRFHSWEIGADEIAAAGLGWASTTEDVPRVEMVLPPGRIIAIPVSPAPRPHVFGPLGEEAAP